MAGDRPDQPRGVLELALAAREPRRRGGEERERRERHPREERHAADVAAKAVPREEPEQPGDQVRAQEVAHVDGPGGVVVPAQVRGPVPEPVLQPDRRDVAAEECRVGLELRSVPRGEEEAVGVAAQEVVDREHEREREPLEDHAPRPAAEIRRREREQAEHDPEEQALAAGRHAVPPHGCAQHRDVQSRRCPAQRPPRGENGMHPPRLTLAGTAQPRANFPFGAHLVAIERRARVAQCGRSLRNGRVRRWARTSAGCAPNVEGRRAMGRARRPQQARRGTDRGRYPLCCHRSERAREKRVIPGRRLQPFYVGRAGEPAADAPPPATWNRTRRSVRAGGRPR